MAITRVQGHGNVMTAAQATTLAVGSGQSWAASTAGNAIIVGVGVRVAASGGTLTCADNTANSYTAFPLYNAGGTQNAAIFYCLNALSATTITVTAGATCTMEVFAWEFSGVAAASGTDGNNSSAQVTSTTAASGSLTTVNANDVVIAAVGFGTAGNTYGSPTGGFTIETLLASTVASFAHNTQPGYQIVSSAAAYQMSGTITSASTAGVIAAFKAATAGTKPVSLNIRQAVNRSAVW